MPRLFTGLELPANTAFMLSMLRGGLKGARWIDPENYHITLRFIGDIDDRCADEIVSELDRIHRDPISVALDGLGSFGNGKPHALFARVKPVKELVELQAEQERVLQRIGLKPERRKYVPHVTLARLRGTSAHEAARWLSEHGDFQAPSFVAGRFVLFSAKATVGGGPYVVEEVYPLAA
ncbi:RNA 2',3'-cyclic phosphodiesterase [Rhodobacteraceae bacterium RKSG542]|uniref:RNA 2',3'-cyclic phosphodiesterase n=1 Tax=Pseudovibrio flavus TaxID=2529854 RepID=UPI0012BC9149|nr:RNA 2',3'-cyclic phosphodiesterase [Pseudovibrio flavus]MTI18277.1 RNA 2',3'-cyclic phosphodiesterase [Pseudovibrio flavus]